MTMQEQIRGILDAHSDLEGALLPILHAVQDALGHIPPEAEVQLASACNLSLAEVRGVISFYHDFRSSPGGRHRVKICCAEACQARGSRNLASHACKHLGVEFGDTTADGLITLEKAYCLGNCACGPSVGIGDEVHANTDAKKFEQLVAKLAVESDQ